MVGNMSDVRCAREFGLTWTQTRKRAMYTEGRTAKRVKSGQHPSRERDSCSPGVPPSGDSATMAGDTDTSTEVMDHHYLALRQSIAMLDEWSKHSICREVRDEDVRGEMTAMWIAMQRASESYERCFDCFEHAQTLAIMRRPSYVARGRNGRHRHELTRSAQMMSLVVDVLRTEVFEADLPRQLGQLSPLPASLDCLHRSRTPMATNDRQLQLT